MTQILLSLSAAFFHLDLACFYLGKERKKEKDKEGLFPPSSFLFMHYAWEDGSIALRHFILVSHSLTMKEEKEGKNLTEISSPPQDKNPFVKKKIKQNSFSLRRKTR